MHWIVLGIIALALIITASSYPRLAFGLLAAFLGVGILLVQVIPGERESAQNIVDASQVEISNVEVVGAYAGSFDLSARVFNHSLISSLSELTLKISLDDCSDESESDQHCQALGSSTVQVAVNIPANEARDFQVNLSFPSAMVRGSARWRVEPVSALGRN
ncbi:hypothetical protein ACMAY5_12880 [Arenicellales bacterium nBUS_48]|jgi:hypothetical protein